MIKHSWLFVTLYIVALIIAIACVVYFGFGIGKVVKNEPQVATSTIVEHGIKVCEFGECVDVDSVQYPVGCLNATYGTSTVKALVCPNGMMIINNLVK